MTEEMIEFVYDVPCQSDEVVERHNKQMMEHFPNYTPLKSTEEHCYDLADKLIDAIYDVGEKGGWFVGDGIKVTVKIEYDPADK